MIGTCWVTTSWESDAWAVGSWAGGSTAVPWGDGLYFMIPMGGGVIYLKRL